MTTSDQRASIARDLSPQWSARDFDMETSPSDSSDKLDDDFLSLFPGCCGRPLALPAVALAGLGSIMMGFHLSAFNATLLPINIDLEWCRPDCRVVGLDFDQRQECEFELEGSDVPFWVPAYTSCKSATVYNAFLACAVFFGAGAGGVTAAKFNYYGRRGILILAGVMGILGTVTGVVAYSFGSLLWYRLLVGYSTGLFSYMTPMYITEMSPKDKRGLYTSSTVALYAMGTLTAICMGLPCDIPPTYPNDICYEEHHASEINPETGDPWGADGDCISSECLLAGPEGDSDIHPEYVGSCHDSGNRCCGEWRSEFEEHVKWNQSDFDKIWWRIVLASGLLFAVPGIVGLLHCFKFETPHWYGGSGEEDKSRITLQRLNGKDDVMDELNDISEGLDAAMKGDQLATVASIHKDTEATRAFWVANIFGAMMAFCGIDVFITTSNSLFQNAGLQGRQVTLASAFLMFVALLIAIPAMFVIEKVGRRPLLIFGTTGQSLSLLPATVCYWIDSDADYTMWLAIAGIFGMVIFFHFASAPVFWVFCWEIFPPDLKPIGTTWLTGVTWFCAVVELFISPFLSNRGIFTLFFITNLIFVAFAVLMVKETKGENLDVSPYFPSRKNDVVIEPLDVSSSDKTLETLASNKT